MAEVGRADIEVHADTDPFEREIGPKIRVAAEDAEKILDITGKQWGKTLSDSTTKELGKHGDDFGRSIERATEKVKVKIKSDFNIDRNGRLHDRMGRFIAEESARALASVGGPGGPLSKVGQGIADAIGSGFNVSGRSPLISVLGVGIGALVGIILAAVQAANALVAVIATIPALIGSIALQVGVLFLAFKGVGSAIQGAFAAKNAKELNAAIKDLTPPAQQFVKSLLPLRDIFKDLQRLTQSAFFTALGDAVPRVVNALAPLLRSGLPQLATALGGFFRGLGIFFSSPTFKEFVAKVIPATTTWLGKFGLGFVELLRVTTRMATATLPFLTRLGDILNNAMHTFSSWLDEQLSSGTFQQWLSDMGGTLESIVELFFKVTEFVASFLAQLNKAGGDKIIDQLSDSMEQLVFFLQSPAGQEFFKGLVNGSIMFIQAATGLIELIFGLIAAFQLAVDSIGAFFTWFTDGWSQLFKGAWEDAQTLWLLLGEAWLGIKEAVLGFINWFVEGWKKTWNGAKTTVTDAWDAIVNFVKAIPGKIAAFFNALPGMLANLGRSAANSLINALIGGMTGAGGAIGRAMGSVVGQVASYLPGSPAERGPLSGRGYAKLRGERMVSDLASGMSAGAPELQMASAEAMQNITFGDVNLNFQGALPTDGQAKGLGAAAMTGIESQLTRRQIRLAVRTA